jgi:hypothetical protein
VIVLLPNKSGIDSLDPDEYIFSFTFTIDATSVRVGVTVSEETVLGTLAV